MSIKFPCPHCKKPLKVKEELGGKKAKCPACQQILTIPRPVAAPADIEALAAAALADKPAAAVPDPEPKTIDFTCFYCEAELHVDASLAGKQTPCPECKHIVKVPLLVKNQPKDSAHQPMATDRPGHGAMPSRPQREHGVRQPR